MTWQEKALEKHNELRARHENTPPLTWAKGLIEGSQV